MRWLVCGLSIAIAVPALAADYDDSWLRGSQVVGPPAPPPSRLYRNWGGVYGGAQVGEDFHGVDFRNVPAGPIASAIQQDAILSALSASLPGMPSLPQLNTNGPSYGGFIGYNWQIDDMVGGVEFNANRASLHATASSSVTRSYVATTGGNTYAPTTVTVASSGTIDMSTYGTVRGRVGWAIGNFLPYLVAGVSFAQIDTSRFVDINYFGVDVTSPACTPPVTPACQNVGGNYPFTNVDHGKYFAGFDVALGTDYLVTQNVFVRGEVEYLQLGNLDGMKLNTVSARTALGLKF
jgi:outer membrane immunogenic protein